jgi:hypothetical protein
MNPHPRTLDRARNLARAVTGLGMLLLIVCLLARLAKPVLIRMSGFEVSSTEVLAGAAAWFLLVAAFLQARLLLTFASSGPSPSFARPLITGLCLSLIGLTASALLGLGGMRQRGSDRDIAILNPLTEEERVRQAMVELQTLEGALVGYRMIHGKWPVPVQTNADTIVGVEAHQAFVETVLKGVDPGTFAGIFIGMRPESFTQGKLLDPWGHPYHIVIDSNGDGACVTDAIGTLKARDVVVWSDGPGKVYLQPQFR